MRLSIPTTEHTIPESTVIASLKLWGTVAGRAFMTQNWKEMTSEVATPRIDHDPEEKQNRDGCFRVN